MTSELETKVLDVDVEQVEKSLQALGAKKIFESRLRVNWYRSPGTKEVEDPWFLRLRSDSEDHCELTWKGISTKLGASRTHHEINIVVSNHKTASELLKAIGLEEYAYQEKDRISWTFKDWRFDLDRYPNMPAYLEIEGKSEESILEAVKVLSLQNHQTSNDGERLLIQKRYGLNWNDMRF